MRVVIIGGAAGSKISQDIYLRLRIPIAGFMNNHVPPELEHHLVAPLLGDYHLEKNAKLLKNPNIAYFVATGDNHMRKQHVKRLFNLTGKFPMNAIHPRAVISPTAKIGWGNLIMPNVVINPHTQVGCGVIINTGAVVEHDNHIGDYVQIAPGAHLGGYVTIMELALVGMGANVLPHVRIGDGAIVAAGAAVLEDVQPYSLVAGVPAKFKKWLK